MNGQDVLRMRDEWRPRLTAFLEPDETLDVVLHASAGPARGVRLLRDTVWPFLRSHDRFLLVATDRRWIVVESERERWRGDLHARASFPRDIRVDPSWTTRTEAFDQPYAIDPSDTLTAIAANDARDARARGESWSLEQVAATLEAADDDPASQALEGAVMRFGRLIPRRPGASRQR
jgi:hypothetical protein